MDTLYVVSKIIHIVLLLEIASLGNIGIYSMSSPFRVHCK